MGVCIVTMDDKITKINGKQNERIARLEQCMDDHIKAWNQFINNDFHHLKKDVKRMFWLVVVGILVPIVLFIIQYD